MNMDDLKNMITDCISFNFPEYKNDLKTRKCKDGYKIIYNNGWNYVHLERYTEDPYKATSLSIKDTINSLIKFYS